MRWVARIGALLLLVVGVLLFREVRSSTSAPSPSVKKGAGEPASDSPEPVTSDTPRGKPEAVVTRDSAQPKMPSGPAPSRSGDTNGGGGIALPDATEPANDDMNIDDPNHPVWAKQNGEEPSAWRVRVRIGQMALERGNYKGALKQVNLIITEEPTFTDAYKVAIPALCATGDLTTAQQYLGRLKEDVDRKEVSEACSNLGGKLNL